MTVKYSSYCCENTPGLGYWYGLGFFESHLLIGQFSLNFSYTDHSSSFATVIIIVQPFNTINHYHIYDQMRCTLTRYNQASSIQMAAVKNQLKKQITYIHPNIKLPHNAQVWKHKSFNYYAGRHLSLAEYFTKQIVQKESLDTFSEIKNAFTVIQSRESRRILELNESKASGAPSDKTFTHLVTDRNDHLALKCRTNELKLDLNSSLFFAAFDLWCSLIINADPSNRASHFLLKNKVNPENIQLSDLPNEIFDILLSLIPIDSSTVKIRTDPVAWSDFDKFWGPIVNSPVCITLIPQLVARASQLFSPNVGISLLHHIDGDAFLSKFPSHNSAYVRYQKGLSAGLNSLISFISFYRVRSRTDALKAPTSPLLLDFQFSDTDSKELQSPDSLQAYKNCDLIYDAIEKLNLEKLDIFPKVMARILQHLPRRTMADFYALLLSKNVEISDKCYRYMTDQLLFNGTDSEKYLITNTDLVKHRAYEQNKQTQINNNLEAPDDATENSSHDTTNNDTNVLSSSSSPLPSSEPNLPKPTFHIDSYSSILKVAIQDQDVNLVTFIRDQLLPQYLSKYVDSSNNIQEKNKKFEQIMESVLLLALRVCVDLGNMEEAGKLMEFWAKDPNFVPTDKIYTLMFRGFRKMGNGSKKVVGTGPQESLEHSDIDSLFSRNICYAGDIGEVKCFEILRQIHNKGTPLSPVICTEVLSLLKDRYSARVVYEYYKAFFGVSVLEGLGFNKYLEEFTDSPTGSYPPPNYVPSVFPPGTDIASLPQNSLSGIKTEIWTVKQTRVFDTDEITNLGDWTSFQLRAPGPVCVHKFNPLALSILYDCILFSTQQLQHVSMLYHSFRNSTYFTNPSLLLPVVDSFVRTLCVRYQNPMAIAVAKSIIWDLFNNPVFKRYEPALKPDVDSSNEKDASSAQQEQQSSEFDSNTTNPDSAPKSTGNAYIHFPTKISSRYPGPRLNCIGYVIHSLCRANDVQSAVEILAHACHNSPIVTGSMFEPVVQYYFVHGDIEKARELFYGAQKIGAHIKNPALMKLIGVKAQEQKQ